jgi:hypothetical protein
MDLTALKDFSIIVGGLVTIVAFANVGTTALVFAGALDITVVVLFAVGIAGLAFSLTSEFKLKAIVSIAWKGRSTSSW